jgi:hypothetical protein
VVIAPLCNGFWKTARSTLVSLQLCSMFSVVAALDGGPAHPCSCVSCLASRCVRRAWGEPTPAGSSRCTA